MSFLTPTTKVWCVLEVLKLPNRSPTSVGQAARAASGPLPRPMRMMPRLSLVRARVCSCAHTRIDARAGAAPRRRRAAAIGRAIRRAIGRAIRRAIGRAIDRQGYRLCPLFSPTLAHCTSSLFVYTFSICLARSPRRSASGPFHTPRLRGIPLLPAGTLHTHSHSRTRTGYLLRPGVASTRGTLSQTGHPTGRGAVSVAELSTALTRQPGWTDEAESASLVGAQPRCVRA